MPEAQGRRDPAYLLYRTGRLLASALPEPVLFPGANLAGAAVAKVNEKRRDVIRRNLGRVVSDGELDRAVAEAFRSYARYWVETLRIPEPGPDEILRRTTSEGLDNVRRHVESGRGVIFVTPHLGSWDVAGAWLAAHGWRVIAVAERVEPPALFDLFVELRRQAGLEILPLGPSSTARALLSGLRQGAVVGLVADRDISGTGVEVEFFGEKTMLPPGPAVLAMRTGSVLAAGALYQRPGGRYHGVILDPVEVAERKADPESIVELTQRVARDLETLIRREPGQWHLFQPNWPSDPGYRAG